MQKQDRPVAFFDSGLGGISVLRETVRLLPQENYLYYGDSLHAPYGVKSEAQIQALSLAAAEHLVAPEPRPSSWPATRRHPPPSACCGKSTRTFP